MIALGHAFGQVAHGGEVFLLDGPLGSGKTQWVKGLGRGLGIAEIINSPTYTIVKPYVGRLTLHHVDLYRLDSVAGCRELGIEDLIGNTAVLAVEWADRWPELGGEAAAALRFEFGSVETERLVTLSCSGSLRQEQTRGIAQMARACPEVRQL